MKLKAFTVTNFRSVTDSGTINVSDITCLMGANQSGKSSILQALNSLSLDETYRDFDLTQLDGVFKRYMDSELKPEEIPIIRATFELTSAEQESIKDVPLSTEDKGTISVTKYYDNCYRVENGDDVYRFWSRPEIEKAHVSVAALISEFSAAASQQMSKPPNNEFQAQFQAAVTELNGLLTTEGIRAAEGTPESILGISDRLRQMAVDGALVEIMSQHLRYLNQFARGLALYRLFASNMPRPVYFKTYDKLEDEASVSDLKTSAEKYKTFVNLLKLAGLKVDSLARIENEKQKQAYVENASGVATSLLTGAWKSEGLQVQFRYQGDRLMVFTKDSNALETLLPPSSGSEGFQWFLGFYINFGAATDADYKNAILLLDDPGVFLHPKGHKDLLELFERYLAKDVTTIYSTHLPFLVPKDRLERLRLVEKLSQGRTSVTEKFYAAHDKDVLFPIRAAIGVTLGDSLFVGKETIVVEGPADHILINGMMKELHERTKKSLCDDVTFLATQGADKTKEYSVLLQINGFSYVVILDNDDKGRATKAKLIAAGVTEARVILLPVNGEEGQASLDIEDLFSVEVYSRAFVSTYGVLVNMDEDAVRKALQERAGKVNNRAKDILKRSNRELDKVVMANAIMNGVRESNELDETTAKAFQSLFDKVAAQIHLYPSGSD